ncbi:MAG: hypothetical protein IJ593_03785 [Lachnospiraceae bacterium]|nr:hypothetical protein [Lachnospiraceae bacterium]
MSVALIKYVSSGANFNNDDNFVIDGCLAGSVSHNMGKNLNETKRIPVLTFYNFSELSFR